MAVQATRRMVLLLVTALMVVAMMTVAVMAATSAFAQGGSEKSCGKANPEFPAKNNVVSECGAENNPNYPDKPKGF